MGFEVRIKIFLPSSCCIREFLAELKRRRCSHGCGAVDLCQHAIQELPCDLSVTRYCISQILMVLMQARDAECWMGWWS